MHAANSCNCNVFASAGPKYQQKIFEIKFQVDFQCYLQIKNRQFKSNISINMIIMFCTCFFIFIFLLVLQTRIESFLDVRYTSSATSTLNIGWDCGQTKNSSSFEHNLTWWWWEHESVLRRHIESFVQGGHLIYLRLASISFFLHIRIYLLLI